jgi:lysophospholipase L1-like esterase
MKQILIFLFLLIACPAWGAGFPFVAGETEVRTYFALPNPTGTVKDLNAQIKILNAGGTITLSSFTGKLSLVGGTAFITNPSVDLRKYVGYKITLNDGTNDLVGWIRSAGTGETEEDKVTGDDSTFASDTGFWTKGTGWTIGSNIASYSGTGSAAQLIKSGLFSTGQLCKYSVDLTLTSGSFRVYVGAAYDVQHTTSGTKTGYVTCGTSKLSNGLWGSTTGVLTADNLTMKLISTPSATGTVVWNGVGNSWVAGDTTINTKAASYTVTIGNGAYKSWLSIGDSKTQYGDAADGWQQLLLTALHTAEPSSKWVYVNRGISSKTVAWYAANIDAQLATIPDDMQQDYIFLNFGANDWDSVLNETTWKTQYQYIIDACHTKFPNAIIYISKPWERTHDADAVTMGGWIDDLITTNSTIMFVADDETGWLKGSDDGATMSSDGTHYSTAGQIEKKNQMLTVLGY